MLFNNCVAVSAETVTRTETVMHDDVVFTEREYFNNTDDYETVAFSCSDAIDFSKIDLPFDKSAAGVRVSVSFEYWVDISIKYAYIDVWAENSVHWNSLNSTLKVATPYGLNEYEDSFGSNSDSGNHTRTLEINGDLKELEFDAKVSRSVMSNGKGDSYVEMTVGIKNIVFEFSWEEEYMDIVVDNKLLENVYRPSSTPSIDENSTSLVLNRRYDDLLLSRKFRLGYDYSMGSGTYYDEGNVITEGGSFSSSSQGTTTDNITEYITTTGTFSNSYTIGGTANEFFYEESGGSSNYTIDFSYATNFSLGTTLDPKQLYFFDFDFDDVNIYMNIPDSATAYYTYANSYILVQGQKFECGDLWSTDFLIHTINASEFQYVVELSFVVSLYNVNDILMSDCYELGILFDNPSISIYDYGVYDKTDDVIDSIQGGNNLQDESNQLQDKNNQLQEEQNETTNNIFSSITDFFGGFFDNLIGIFVPEDGYFEDFFARLNNFFSDKLGMLYTPVDIFVEVLGAIQNSGGDGGGLVFPEVKFQEYVIIEQQTINLNSIAGEFDGLQDAVYLGTDVIMIGGILELLQNKLKEVLKT